MGDRIGKTLSSKKDWIELFPYGVTFSADAFASRQRPVMFFKDKTGEKVLPVWLSPLDAGIALAQQESHGMASSPHNLTWKILEPLGVELDHCLFTEVKGHHQFLELHFKKGPGLKRLESRADEAISFCLSTRCQFFCQSDFIEKCRVLDAEMMQDQAPLQPHPSLDQIRHPYIN